MSIWHHPLTDLRSARIRFFLSLLWSLPLLIPVWFIQQSIGDVLAITSAFCVMSIIDLIFDQRRIRNRNMSASAETKWRSIFTAIVILGLVLSV